MCETHVRACHLCQALSACFICVTCETHVCASQFTPSLSAHVICAPISVPLVAEPCDWFAAAAAGLLVAEPCEWFAAAVVGF